MGKVKKTKKSKEGRSGPAQFPAVGVPGMTLPMLHAPVITVPQPALEPQPKKKKEGIKPPAPMPTPLPLSAPAPAPTSAPVAMATNMGALGFPALLTAAAEQVSIGDLDMQRPPEKKKKKHHDDTGKRAIEADHSGMMIPGPPTGVHHHQLPHMPAPTNMLIPQPMSLPGVHPHGVPGGLILVPNAAGGGVGGSIGGSHAGSVQGEVPKRKGRMAKPKQPRSAYSMFMSERHAELQEKHPNAVFKDMAHLVSEEWQALGEKQKAVYYNKAKEDEQRYEAEYALYMATHPGAILKAPRAQREAAKSRPKMPHSAYQLYVEHEYPKIAAQHGDAKVAAKEIMTEIAKKWKAKTEEQKQKWHSRLEHAKDVYREYLDSLPLDEREAIDEEERQKKQRRKIKMEEGEDEYGTRGKPPKMSKNAFQFWLARSGVREQYGENGSQKQLGEMWRNMPEAEKQQWLNSFAMTREEYERRFPQMRTSTNTHSGWIWQFRVRDFAWYDYGDEARSILSTAYKDYKETRTTQQATVHWNDETYIVDFNTMTQTAHGSLSKTMAVRCLAVVPP